MAHPKMALLLVPLLLLCLSPVAAAPQTSGSADDLKDGIDQFRNGQFDRAILLFHNVLLDPSAGSLKADASLLIAKSYMATGKLEEAGQNLDFYLATFPSAPDYAEAVYQKGRLLFMQDDFEGSLKVLQGFLSTYPKSTFVASGWFWAAESLYGLGRLDEAQAIYAKIVKDFPSSVKTEASQYKLELIDIRKKEVELAKLLKYSHEELLKTVEEYQNREQSYQQAIDAYQRRLGSASSPDDLKTIADLRRQAAQQADQVSRLQSQLSAAGVASADRTSDQSLMQKTLAAKAAALALKEQYLDLVSGSTK
jgi:TolA-binding protein